MTTRRKATAKAETATFTDPLVPPVDVEPDPYVDNPHYDKANDDVDPDAVGDPHMGPLPDDEPTKSSVQAYTRSKK